MLRGGIGSQVVKLLLQNSEVAEVRVIVRTAEKLPTAVRSDPKLKIIAITSLLEISEDEMVEHLRDINAVIFSLGHTMSFKGIFLSGLLVLEACKLVCSAIIKSKQPCKLIEVNTIRVEKPDGTEIKRSLGNNIMTGILRILLPPCRDSTMQARYMLSEIGHKNKYVEWVLVRPDGLQNEADVTES